jgi:hypothetical protein
MQAVIRGRLNPFSLMKLTIRVVTDFRKLILLLKSHQFPIPKIGDMLCSMKGFTFASTLDSNMSYYLIKLNADAQTLCTNVSHNI